MSATRRELIILKRGLLAARSEIEALVATAHRAGEGSLARRLLTIVRRLTAEMDFVDRLLGRLP